MKVAVHVKFHTYSFTTLFYIHTNVHIILPHQYKAWSNKPDWVNSLADTSSLHQTEMYQFLCTISDIKLPNNSDLYVYVEGTSL